MCLLSPLLFPILLDWVSNQAAADNETGIQLTLLQKLEDLDFADAAARISCQGQVQGKCNQFQGEEDLAHIRHWQQQLCRRVPGASNSLHIPWQPDHYY